MKRTKVKIRNDVMVGFFGFGLDEDEPEMTHLFVEPTLRSADSIYKLRSKGLPTDRSFKYELDF